MNRSTSSPPEIARELFAPIASTYERGARWLSMGQDDRWRRAMVDGLALDAGDRVLDVACGTGSITRELQQRGHATISLDQSPEMVAEAKQRGATVVRAGGERLPFADGTFDAVTFGYLLRYVSDVRGCLEELVRVVRPGGRLGMVEFGRPRGLWRGPWWLYTRVGLPTAGLLTGRGWLSVGRFLGPSIDRFAANYPPDRLQRVWREAGLVDVEHSRMSLGGGLVMWGRRP